MVVRGLQLGVNGIHEMAIQLISTNNPIIKISIHAHYQMAISLLKFGPVMKLRWPLTLIKHALVLIGAQNCVQRFPVLSFVDPVAKMNQYATSIRVAKKSMKKKKATQSVSIVLKDLSNHQMEKERACLARLVGIA